MTLPPIREWWAQLTPEARNEVLEGDGVLLQERTRGEIREITGAVVGAAEALSDADLKYAHAHADQGADTAG